jgi:hypothetical protein
MNSEKIVVDTPLQSYKFSVPTFSLSREPNMP